MLISILSYPETEDYRRYDTECDKSKKVQQKGPSVRASNRKQHAQILTSPDVIAAKRTKKEIMKATAEKRAQNAAKKKSNLKQTVVKKGKNQKLRQRIESSSSSSSSVEMSVHSTDDDQDIIDEKLEDLDEVCADDSRAGYLKENDDIFYDDNEDERSDDDSKDDEKYGSSDEES
ncbi:hypothetical protein FQA39_LY00804 [Lamprigera yunnana]|nr:hypothetical protein FQA39_LY00804 [Lamprigera yunnana]